MYKNYAADWSRIKQWFDDLDPISYAAKTLTTEDINTISITAKLCKGGITCPLTARNEFETYLKYCMFNLNACNFQPF